MMMTMVMVVIITIMIKKYYRVIFATIALVSPAICQPCDIVHATGQHCHFIIGLYIHKFVTNAQSKTKHLKIHHSRAAP